MAAKKHSEALAVGRAVTRGLSSAAAKALKAQQIARDVAGVGSPAHTPSMIEALMRVGKIRVRDYGRERLEVVEHAYLAGGAPQGYVDRDIFFAYQWWVS